MQRLLHKTWKGWASSSESNLCIDAAELLRLAEGRVGGGKETSKAQPAYFVPTLDLPSQAPENAYSHEESVRRVNILVGEAVLQTLILVVMKSCSS